MSLLAIDNVSKTYGRTRALKGASLTVARGEVHALMGENGAGKSTLIKILAGVVAPDTMEMTVDGRPVALRGAQDAFDLGFRFIHQELNVVAHLSVAENMAMGKPCPRRFGVAVDWPALNAQAHAALDRLGVGHIDPRTKIGRLSAGDQMLVSIAGALSATGEGARLFVMDEPTASLTGDECDKLFAVIETLKSEGASVLYVSHRMNEVMAICDTVTVYRDGRHVATKPVSETGKDQIIRFMTGRDVADAFPPRTTPVGERVVCRVDDVSTEVLCGIDFALREGEILGIGGLANAGQSELLQMLLGLGTRRSGRVEIASAPGLADPSDPWTHGVAYVPRERRREGLMLARPITDNVVLPHLTALSRAGTIAHRRRERALTAEMGGVVRLKSDGLAQPVYQLSGGNQQKVVFARAVGAAPRLLLLDEPTRGVDVGAKFDIYTLIRELSGQGCSVVLTSSELTELIGLCDRILILLDGRQSEIVATDGLTSADLLGRFYDEAHGGHAAA